MSCICRQIRHKSTLKRASTSRKSTTLPVKREFRYPLAEALDLRAQQSYDKNESSGVNVVNEELCDEALNLLAPSLENYKGCNIIDVFPGPGLWSRKIHELLKPRAHILVGHPKDTYESFLQPLLDQAGSRYRFRSLEQPRFYGSRFYEDVLADLDQPARSTAGNVEPNNNILVLATLTKLPKVSSSLQHKIENSHNVVSKDISPAEPFVFDFLRHLQCRTGPHSFGPSRLLFWSLDRDKFNFLPRNVLGRVNMPLEVEEACSVQEIVGSASPPKAKRLANLELYSAIAAAERMKFSGVSLPPHRRSHIHQSVLNHTSMISSGVHEKGSRENELIKTLTELHDIETRWAFDGFKRSRNSTSSDDKRRKEFTDEYSRMIELRDSLDELAGKDYRDTKRITDSMRKALTIQILLNKLERESLSANSESLLTQKPDSADDKPLVSKFGSYDIKQLNDRIAEISDRMGDQAVTTMQRVSDDHEALFSKPPLLNWDRRSFEPLESSQDDFYPQRKLALLDFQPKSVSAEQLVSRIPLVRVMRPTGQMTVSGSLDRIVNGAGEALLSNCPTINDPLQGGRLDLQNMRVRMLTHDMWRELVLAWKRWPFKKDDEQLTAELSTSAQYDGWHTEDPTL